MKINTSVFVSVAAACLLGLGCSGAASAAPAFANHSFEDGVSTGWDLMTATNTPGWTILYGNGAVFPRLNLNQASGGPYGNNNDGRQFATLGGTEDNATSALEQSVGGFTSGQKYTLTWIQASEFTANDLLDVSFLGGSATGGGSFGAGPYPGGSAYWTSWKMMSMTFTANQAVVDFHFQGDSGSQYEVGVDNFQISGANVPEPTIWALMIGGFGLAGLALRRRHAVLTA